MLLEAKGIKKSFGGLMAVDGVDFELGDGRIESIIGPNGAGKTTFFNIISGNYHPDEGQVIFDGHDITRSTPDRAAACGIARTFQNIRLFPELMAAENVLVGMHLHLSVGIGHIIFNTKKARREEQQAYDEALELIRYAGLEGKEKELARSLPYGDQRRLEVARALAVKPKMLLLDEPTAGMNPRETDEMKEFILRLRDEKKVTILLIEHDMKVVMGISDRITVLNYGVKIAEGKPQEIRNNPEVIKAYLGQEAG
ncbi:MAG TPA: ABC transporter ATP-binding protein [Syntrophomonadaceae bacterium]|nr:ABC transporter ATP-binding protein [Syntrophomonadaceae bacterium]